MAGLVPLLVDLPWSGALIAARAAGRSPSSHENRAAGRLHQPGHDSAALGAPGCADRAVLPLIEPPRGDTDRGATSSARTTACDHILPAPIRGSVPTR